jgi:UDP-N-acetylmuramyl tripeptide synthase
MFVSLKYALHRLIPPQLFSVYHFLLAGLAALVYGFPSRDIVVVGVTGTKGKSSTVEFLNSIFGVTGKKNAQVRFDLKSAHSLARIFCA